MREIVIVMSTFFPLRPCLGCWPVVGVGEMGVGMREGSETLTAGLEMLTAQAIQWDLGDL